MNSLFSDFYQQNTLPQNLLTGLPERQQGPIKYIKTLPSGFF